MPVTSNVPHETWEGAPEKYTITQQCFYSLTELDALGRPFKHCSSRQQRPLFGAKGNVLMFWPGYSWNGASGPGRDTPHNRLATLVHDSLYQAIRLGRVSKYLKRRFDDELFQIMKEDQERRWRRVVWWLARGFMSPGKSDEKYNECPDTTIETEGVLELMPRDRIRR